MADGLGYRNRVEGNINYPEAGNLPNIVTLNLGAVYRLNKQIHFSAQLNNFALETYRPVLRNAGTTFPFSCRGGSSFLRFFERL